MKKRTGQLKEASRFAPMTITNKSISRANLAILARNARENRRFFKAWLKKQIEREWGKPCGRYQKGCGLCEAWKCYKEIK